MFLYHISRCYDITEDFIPRQPELSISVNGEVTSIDRISVSSSIAGCFSAVYFGCNELRYSRYWNNLYDDTPKELDDLYLFPFKLYVFAIDERDTHIYKTPKELHALGVPDAILTEEHWLLERTVPTEVYNLYVEDFFIVKKDYVVDGVSRVLACVDGLRYTLEKLV